MQNRTEWQAMTSSQALFLPTVSRGAHLPLADLIDKWRRVRDDLDALRAARPDLFTGRAVE